MDELIERLAVARDEDDELRKDVLLAVSPSYKGFERHHIGGAHRILRSVDDAIDLVGEALPGWDYLICRVSSGYSAEVGPPDSFQQVKADAPTPALALCIALLKALRAADKQGGGG